MNKEPCVVAFFNWQEQSFAATSKCRLKFPIVKFFRIGKSSIQHHLAHSFMQLLRDWYQKQTYKRTPEVTA